MPSSTASAVVAPSEALGRIAGKKQHKEQGIFESTPQPAVSLPSPGRCQRRHIGVLQTPTATPQPPDEINIFHQREISISPQLVEHGTPDEQRLIPVRQIEQR